MAQTQSIDPKTLFDAGVHMGRVRSRRHPSAEKFIFTTKDKSDIFDMEETAKMLEKALEKVKAVAASGAQVLFVGGKTEIANALKQAAQKAGVPFVAGRWIGGTLTNFKQIRKRIDRMEKLINERERGERDKYTKLERLMFDREIDELQFRFGGLVEMRDLPSALFVIDSEYQKIAVNEARQLHIPVIALMSSDCDFSSADFPIPANTSSVKSIRLLLQMVTDAVITGRASSAKTPVKSE